MHLWMIRLTIVFTKGKGNNAGRCFSRRIDFLLNEWKNDEILWPQALHGLSERHASLGEIGFVCFQGIQITYNEYCIQNRCNLFVNLRGGKECATLCQYNRKPTLILVHSKVMCIWILVSIFVQREQKYWQIF